MRALVTGDPASQQDARERAAQALARARNVGVEEARTQVQQFEQQYRQTMDQAKQKATQAADLAAKGVSRGAILAAISLLLGGLASWLGGRMGAVDPTLTEWRGAYGRTDVDVSDQRTGTNRDTNRRVS
jgi:hypothetical protein